MCVCVCMYVCVTRPALGTGFAPSGKPSLTGSVIQLSGSPVTHLGGHLLHMTQPLLPVLARHWDMRLSRTAPVHHDIHTLYVIYHV